MFHFASLQNDQSIIIHLNIDNGGITRLFHSKETFAVFLLSQKKNSQRFYSLVLTSIDSDDYVSIVTKFVFLFMSAEYVFDEDTSTEIRRILQHLWCLHCRLEMSLYSSRERKREIEDHQRAFHTICVINQ